MPDKIELQVRVCFDWPQGDSRCRCNRFLNLEGVFRLSDYNVSIYWELLHFLDLPGGPTNFDAINLCYISDTNQQLGRALSHKRVRREQITDNLPAATVQDDTRTNSRTVAGFADEMQPHPVTWWKAVQEQTQRSTTYRANQQVDCPVTIEVSGHH